MEDGREEVEDGGWRMADGRWGMAGDGERTENSGRGMEDSREKGMDRGQEGDGRTRGQLWIPQITQFQSRPESRKHTSRLSLQSHIQTLAYLTFL